MRRTLMVMGLLLVASGPVTALTSQQEKMKDCNAQATAKALKGDERKQFMSTCLSAGQEAQHVSQQEKMKMCNQEAGKQNLKGDQRKQFMSTCLSGK